MGKMRKRSAWRTVALLCTLAGCALALVAAGAAATGRPTLVVDDDGVQCGWDRSLRSIQEAVDEAQPGSVIRVCPGLYAESVAVDKPLEIRGQLDAVEGLDCFAPNLGTLSADEQAIVDPPGDTAIGFTLAADDVRLAGFVIQGGSIGVTTSDEYSGYRVDHNLMRMQRQYQVAPGILPGGYSLGFGTGGQAVSRVDHNCSRDNAKANPTQPGNGWGLTDDGGAGEVIGARIDHNQSYRLDTGIELAFAKHKDVVIDHNESVEDLTGIGLWTSEGESRIFANSSRFGRTRAIIVGGANPGLEIRHNVIEDGFRGIAFATWVPNVGPGPFPVVGVVVRANLIARGASDGILVDSSARLTDSVIAENMIEANGLNGILLRSLTTANTVADNLVLDNGRNGIWAQGATGNTFAGNTMLGNATANPVVQPPLYFDARDDARASNTWTGNQCFTDFPTGTICGIG